MKLQSSSMSGRRRCFGAVLAAMVGTIAVTALAADLPKSVSIGTHRVGLSYHSAGVGLAKVVSEKSPLRMQVKPFAGPNAWMPLLDAGELDLGLLSGMDVGWAFNKKASYKKRYTNIRAMMRGNVIDTLLITRKSSDIKSLADLKGHSVTSNFGGNITAKNIVEVYLSSAGLTWKDVKNVPVPDVRSGFRALREGRAEVAFGGAPSTARELDAAIGSRALSIASAERANAAADVILPSAKVRHIKKGRGWLKEDVDGVGFFIFLAASSKLSADAAYEVVKALWDNYKDLHPIHPWLRGWVHEDMFDPNPSAPYHPGAVRFYKEKGLWSAEAEKNQQALLARAK